MNALDRWRGDQGWTYQRLANALDCNHATASRYCQGRRIPEPVAMARIYVITDGAVTANDFYGLPAPRPWIVTLVHPDRRADFVARGWQPWPETPDPEHPGPTPAEAALLMRRKQRDGETWQHLLAELAAPTGWPDVRPRARPEPGALLATGTDPD